MYGASSLGEEGVDFLEKAVWCGWCGGGVGVFWYGVLGGWYAGGKAGEGVVDLMMRVGGFGGGQCFVFVVGDKPNWMAE